MTQSSSAKADFNPQAIGIYRRGIENRHAGQVQKALTAGVDPNTMHYKGALSPLHPLIREEYEDWTGETLDAEAFEAQTSAIVDLLLAHGLKLAEPLRHEAPHFRYLIDHFMLNNSLADISNLVIHAAYETLSRGDEAYQPSIPSQMRYLCEMSDCDAEDKAMTRHVINQGLLIMESIHETVRARILNPTTEMEKKLMSAYGDKMGYWQKPFSPPSLGYLVNTLFSGEKPSITSGGPMTHVDKTPPGNSPVAQKPPGGDDAEAAANLVQVLERRKPEEVMADIDREFIGLAGAKETVYDLMVGELYDAACTIQDVAPTPERHSAVFAGNPGLGKTTFARKYAELLHALGVTGPNYVEIGPGGAVGKFIGHTEAKIEAILEAADVLFIDEAYDLVSGGGNTADFGRKVLTAVLRAIENRPEMVVIMAGYNEEMNRLISANVGLSSRITKHVNFEDMNRDALGHVLDLMAGQRQYTMAPEAREHILDQIEAARKTLGVREFGNARLVRNVVDKFRVTLGRRHFGAAAKATTVDEGNQARSASPAVKDLRHVTLEDARSLNYGMVLGLAGKKAATADVAPNHPDFEPSVGFGRALRGERMAAPMH